MWLHALQSSQVFLTRPATLPKKQGKHVGAAVDALDPPE